jgi:hypothetical protein
MSPGRVPAPRSFSSSRIDIKSSSRVRVRWIIPEAHFVA